MSNLSDTPIYLCVRDIRPLSSPAKRGVNSTPLDLVTVLTFLSFFFFSFHANRTNERIESPPSAFSPGTRLRIGWKLCLLMARANGA